MKELVDKEKLEEKLDELIYPMLDKEESDGLDDILEKCTLSPAELAGILKGKAWVVERLREKLRDASLTVHSIEIVVVLKWIKNLESQAPVSKFANLSAKDRQAGEIEEDRWKAKEYDAMQKRTKESVRKMREFQEQLDRDIKITRKDLKEEFTEILIQAENPLTAEEEK